MNQEKPLLIVTSCTRNYGWVTRAFLEENTRWADYIVIVDQMSTDETRPLVEEYNALHHQESKAKRHECVHRAEIVIVDDPDMTYKENTRAKMGFMKGRELAAGRDAIYFALDIDEVMPANWMRTDDGKKILASKPGDMYQLQWANIMPNGKDYARLEWQYKVFHDNGMKWQNANIQIHTPLLPYSSWENEPIKILDFPLLHFGDFNEKWTQYKRIYYQFVEIQQSRSKNAISMFRKYNTLQHNEVEAESINKEWLYADADIIRLVDTAATPIFVQYIRDIISAEGIEKFQSIDVWNDDFCQELGVGDPRTARWRLLHAYLRLTQKHHSFILWKIIDKLFKKLY